MVAGRVGLEGWAVSTKDFEVVDDALRRVVTQGRPASGARQALLDGKTIFVPSPRRIAPTFDKTAKPLGLRVRSYRTERGGVPGLVVWFEPRAAS